MVVWTAVSDMGLPDLDFLLPGVSCGAEKDDEKQKQRNDVLFFLNHLLRRTV